MISDSWHLLLFTILYNRKSNTLCSFSFSFAFIATKASFISKVLTHQSLMVITRHNSSISLDICEETYLALFAISYYSPNTYKNRDKKHTSIDEWKNILSFLNKHIHIYYYVLKVQKSFLYLKERVYGYIQNEDKLLWWRRKKIFLFLRDNRYLVQNWEDNLLVEQIFFILISWDLYTKSPLFLPVLSCTSSLLLYPYYYPYKCRFVKSL